MPQGPTPFPQGLYAPVLYLKPIPFASLPVHPQVGMAASVSDSTVSSVGAAITVGGGTNKVNALYNGTNWVVVGAASGNVAAAGFFEYSTAWGLTATGTSRTNALALTAQINQVTTGATTTGVVLPAASTVGVGGFVRVVNADANSFHVYAAGSDTIDGGSGATGVVLTNAFYCDYYVSAAGAFTSIRVAFTASA